MTGRLIIIGAATGIGAAGARHLASRGWRLALLDRNESALTTVAAEIGAVSYSCDVTDADALTTALHSAITDLAGLDALWSNAGVQTSGTVETSDLTDFDHAWLVNVRAHFIAAKTAVPTLRRSGGGSILITASNAGLQPESQMVAYSTTKAAAVHLMKVLARDHAADGIRVNALCPGFVDTPFNDAVWATYGGKTAFLERISDIVPLGRMANADEVARLADFLLGADAGFVTGHALVADGGELLT